MKIYATKTYDAGTEKYSKEFFTFIPDFLEFLDDATVYSGIRYKDSNFKLNFIDRGENEKVFKIEITKENIEKYRNKLEKILKKIPKIKIDKNYFYKNEIVFNYLKTDLENGLKKLLNGDD